MLDILSAQRNSDLSHNKFNAGSGVFRPDAFYKPTIKNKEQFANLKAQAWWLVADRFRNTYNAIEKGESCKPEDMIFIDPTMPHLDRLIDELTMPLCAFDVNGRVKVESKPDMAKRNLASPNLADAFIMAFAPYRAAMVISDKALDDLYTFTPKRGFR